MKTQRYHGHHHVHAFKSSSGLATTSRKGLDGGKEHWQASLLVTVATTCSRTLVQNQHERGFPKTGIRSKETADEM